MATIPFIDDLIARRRPFSNGGDAHRFVELYGGQIVETTAFEPDPRTYRNEFYYNVKLNRLFRKVITDNRPQVGIVRATWRAVSD